MNAFAVRLQDETASKLDRIAGRLDRPHPGTRELVLTDIPFIVAYRVTEARVEILAIVQTSQRWPEEL
jgi:plasmid stabilization system protein ParE